MLVPTVALATAVSLVAVPAIAPPLTTRDVQVAAEVQTALSTAQVKLAADSTALLKGLQLAANVLAGSGAQAVAPIAALLPQPGVAAVQQADPTRLQAAVAAFLANFQDNGPLIASLAAAAAFTGSAVLEAAVQGLVSGGPVGAIIAVINALLPAPAATTALAAQPAASTPIANLLPQPIANLLPQRVAAAPQADPTSPTRLQAATAAFLANFQDNGPLIASLAAFAAFTGSTVLADAVQGLVSGGPVGAIIAILGDLPLSKTATTARAARSEGGTPIGSVAGVFGHNPGRSIVDVLTPRKASEADDSGPAIDAKADPSEKPRFKVLKAPVTRAVDKTNEGTKGADKGNGLVRKGLQFKPKGVLPVGSESGAGAGGGFRPLQGLKDALDRVTGHADDAKGPAGASGNGDGGK
jgi:hypothetical protein